MEKKVDKKIGLTTIILSVIIIVLLVLIIIAIFNLARKKEAELTIQNDKIINLYSYIPAVDSDKVEVNAYQNRLITANDLSDEYKLMSAYKKIDFSIVEPPTNLEDEIEGVINLVFDRQAIQDKVKKMFGINVEDKTFTLGNSGDCVYKNSNYYVILKDNKTEEENIEEIKNIRKLVDVYKENGNLYIIDKYMAYVTKDGTTQLYKSSECNNLIMDEEEPEIPVYEEELNNDTEIVEEDEEIEEEAEDIVEDDMTEEEELDEEGDSIDETGKMEEQQKNEEMVTEEHINEYAGMSWEDMLMKKYDSQIIRYKHTFKKGKDGNYYWYSTEPM